MKKKLAPYGLLFGLLFLPAFLLLTGCKSDKKASDHRPEPVTADVPADAATDDQGIIFKHELIGTYKAETVFPLDSASAAPVNTEISRGWTLKLMDKDNFEFTGNNGKTAIGYWAFADKDNKQNMLLFQSGYMPESVIYAQFNKTQVYFEGPLWMTDSAFRGVIFTRIEK